jgi:hypothetical protein
VKIVLDPYLFNIFPLSLLPTAFYLLAVAVGAWYLSNQIWLALDSFAQSPEKSHSASELSEAATRAKKHI